MEINNNVNAMQIESQRLNELAKDINKSTSMIGDPELQKVTDDLINSIAKQIPTQISYEANGKSIQTQDEVMGSLLNIKV